jgi:hypothetical protein
MPIEPLELDEHQAGAAGQITTTTEGEVHHVRT